MVKVQKKNVLVPELAKADPAEDVEYNPKEKGEAEELSMSQDERELLEQLPTSKNSKNKLENRLHKNIEEVVD